MKRLRWGDDRPADPPLEHPYRDTALVYLGFAVVIVVVAVATGGSFVNAVVIAALFWVAATAVSVVNLRRRGRVR
jgi:hypothetical protein